MKKLVSILLTLILGAPVLCCATQSFAKGEFPKELQQLAKDGDTTAVIITKAALFIAASMSLVLIIMPATRRMGFSLAMGVVMSLGAMILFTDVFTTPLSTLSEKKQVQDFFTRK